MLARLRHLLLTRVLGGGFGGFVVASALGWVLDQIRSADDPVRLDTARLREGETYTVRTRPAMSRREAKVAAAHAQAADKLARATRPSRATISTAAKLQRAQRKAAKSRRRPDSPTAARRAAKAERLGRRFDRLTAEGPKEQRLRARVEKLEHCRALLELDAVGRASTKRRPGATKTFR